MMGGVLDPLLLIKKGLLRFRIKQYMVPNLILALMKEGLVKCQE